MHPIQRELEGHSLLHIKDIKGKYILKEMVKIIKEKDEGYLSWWWSKPNDKNDDYEKIGFIKHLEPLNWFIATGEYIEDVKKDIQKQVLEKISKIKYGKNGYIFILDKKSNLLLHINKKLIGKNPYPSLTDKVLNASSSGEGYTEYSFIEPSSGKFSTKTSFAKRFWKWNWTIGTGVYISDINEIILSKRVQLEKENKEQITSIFIISLVISILLFILAIVFSNIIKKKFINYRKRVNEKNEALKKLNRTLEKEVKRRTDSLNEKTKKVTDLLNNSAQGFLSFDKEFSIDEEHSMECEYLLGKDLKGKDITELLFSNKKDKIPFFKETIVDALNMNNELTQSLLLSLLPNELIIFKKAVLIE